MKKPTKPKKASQVSSKGKAASTQSKARGGASEAKAAPSAHRSAQRQAAEAECEALIAAHLLELEAEQDQEKHQTPQAVGRRALTALTLQDAGYSLAAEIAGGDGQLEISLEALSLWLQELLVPAEHGGFRVFVDTEFFSELKRFVVGSDIGDSIPEKESHTGQTPRPRWQTMPEGSFLHFKRPPHKRLHKGKTRTQVKNASEVRLKTESEEWLWRELARSAIEDAETAKALHHLLGWHQDAAMKFLQRFLASRHSIQNGVKERLLKTARGLALGNEELMKTTTKEDRGRLHRDHPA